MWKISRCTRWGLGLAALLAAPFGAAAQVVTEPNVFGPDRSSIQNQSSFSLPSTPTPYGQDEVRSPTGLSCRSSVASSGPMVDVGIIGSTDVYERDAASVYGRIIVPIGRRPRRIDCTRLYELEIERLRMELELLRMGSPIPIQGN